MLLARAMEVLHHTKSIALICLLTYIDHLAVWHCWRSLKTEIHLILCPPVVTVKDLSSVVSGDPAAVVSGKLCWVGRKEENSL